MDAINDIAGIMIALQVEKQQALFLLLGADGHIDRMGSGHIDAADKAMFIGKTKENLFEQLCSKITSSVEYFLGQNLADPKPVGKICELTVGFRYVRGDEAFSVWRYGSESQGPHPEVIEFVEEALRITEPWFQAEKARVARNSPTK